MRRRGIGKMVKWQAFFENQGGAGVLGGVGFNR